MGGSSVLAATTTGGLGSVSSLLGADRTGSTTSTLPGNLLSSFSTAVNSSKSGDGPLSSVTPTSLIPTTVTSSGLPRSLLSTIASPTSGASTGAKLPDQPQWGSPGFRPASPSSLLSNGPTGVSISSTTGIGGNSVPNLIQQIMAGQTEGRSSAFSAAITATSGGSPAVALSPTSEYTFNISKVFYLFSKIFISMGYRSSAHVCHVKNSDIDQRCDMTSYGQSQETCLFNSVFLSEWQLPNSQVFCAGVDVLSSHGNLVSNSGSQASAVTLSNLNSLLESSSITSSTTSTTAAVTSATGNAATSRSATEAPASPKLFKTSFAPLFNVAPLGLYPLNHENILQYEFLERGMYSLPLCGDTEKSGSLPRTPYHTPPYYPQVIDHKHRLLNSLPEMRRE